VIESLENFAAIILILNAIAGGWLLPVVALLLIVIVSCAIWEITSRLRRNRPRRPSVEELANPAFNPDLDAWETSWRRQQERP